MCSVKDYRMSIAEKTVEYEREWIESITYDDKNVKSLMIAGFTVEMTMKSIQLIIIWMFDGIR